MEPLAPELVARLEALADGLVDAARAGQLVAPTEDAEGFWFGGGNAVRDARDGSLLLIGRYRDAGDSRSGLVRGTRGRELAVFRSEDGARFTQVASWNKADLRCGAEVLSIEGSALRAGRRRIDVLVSSEKVRPYPQQVASFQKPGTGVWSIDAFSAGTLGRLDPVGRIRPLLTSTDPAYLHVKDPNLGPAAGSGRQLLFYCAHPYSWSSSTSGYARLGATGCTDQDPDFLPRGSTWDVAATRVTCRLAVPRLGPFAELPALSLYFYDGAECLRSHQAHQRAVERPRGHSCEELGGLAYGFDRQFPRLHRISLLAPKFVSPEGTGCSRYVSVLADRDGSLFATWQRSVPSKAQPLFGHRLSAGAVTALLA